MPVLSGRPTPPAAGNGGFPGLECRKREGRNLAPGLGRPGRCSCAVSQMEFPQAADASGGLRRKFSNQKISRADTQGTRAG